MDRCSLRIPASLNCSANSTSCRRNTSRPWRMWGPPALLSKASCLPTVSSPWHALAKYIAPCARPTYPLPSGPCPPASLCPSLSPGLSRKGTPDGADACHLGTTHGWRVRNTSTPVTLTCRKFAAYCQSRAYPCARSTLGEPLGHRNTEVEDKAFLPMSDAPMTTLAKAGRYEIVG